MKFLLPGGHGALLKGGRARRDTDCDGEGKCVRKIRQICRRILANLALFLSQHRIAASTSQCESNNILDASNVFNDEYSGNAVAKITSQRVIHHPVFGFLTHGTLRLRITRKVFHEVAPWRAVKTSNAWNCRSRAAHYRANRKLTCPTSWRASLTRW